MEDINRFSYIDPLYKQLKIISIVTNPAANIRTALEGRLCNGPPPAEENKQTILLRRAATSENPIKK